MFLRDSGLVVLDPLATDRSRAPLASDFRQGLFCTLQLTGQLFDKELDPPKLGGAIRFLWFSCGCVVGFPFQPLNVFDFQQGIRKTDSPGNGKFAVRCACTFAAGAEVRRRGAGALRRCALKCAAVVSSGVLGFFSSSKQKRQEAEIIDRTHCPWVERAWVLRSVTCPKKDGYLPARRSNRQGSPGKVQHRS